MSSPFPYHEKIFSWISVSLVSLSVPVSAYVSVPEPMSVYDCMYLYLCLSLCLTLCSYCRIAKDDKNHVMLTGCEDDGEHHAGSRLLHLMHVCIAQ